MTDKKRRCYILASSYGSSSLQKLFQALGQTLAERGNRVIWLVNPRPHIQQNEDANPALVMWPSERPTHLRDAIFLARLIRRTHPDCIIGNFGAVNLTMFVGWLMGVPYRVAWHHTLSAQINADSKLPAWRRRLQIRRQGMVLSRATHLVPVSHAVLQDLTRLYHFPPEKMHVLYHSINDPQAPISDSKRPGSVVCAARLDNTKGQDVLIEAAGRLRDKVPGLTVEFLGDGAAAESYAALVHDLGLDAICTFSGAVSPRQVLEKMAAAAVTVLPSRDEAAGLVILESLSCGTPVIASRVGGIPELITDGVEGFLVPPGDEAALAEKLQMILTDADLQRRMGSNARQRFLKQFEQQQAVPHTAEWLEQLVAGVS